MTITVTIDDDLYARMKRMADEFDEDIEHIVIAGIETEIADMEQFHEIEDEE